MFGPVPAKFLRLNDPYLRSLGPRITATGTILACEYKDALFDVPLSGDKCFQGYGASEPHPRGVLLEHAEISVTGSVPTAEAGRSEAGLIAVLDGVIAVSVTLHPYGNGGPTSALLMDIVSGKPVPLSGPSEALWFREWTLRAKFPGEDGFQIASASSKK